MIRYTRFSQTVDVVCLLLRHVYAGVDMRYAMLMDDAVMPLLPPERCHATPIIFAPLFRRAAAYDATPCRLLIRFDVTLIFTLRFLSL